VQKPRKIKQNFLPETRRPMRRGRAGGLAGRDVGAAAAAGDQAAATVTLDASW
jgi:hypothetical protein